MDQAGITQVLADVFQVHDTKVIRGWVSLRCPIARWTHERGRDTRPSAGVSIQEGTSVFNCMTCKTKVPFQELIRRYADYTGEDLSDIIEEVEEQAYLGPRQLPEWTHRDMNPTLEEPEIIDKDVYLDLYDSAAGHPYVHKRGISDDTAEFLQLKVDPDHATDHEERILFPVFSPSGDLHGFSGRATRSNAALKVRDYAGLRKAACLLGAHLITQEKPDFIAVVEGLVDYANCWQHGIPAVAVMHSTMTELQARILRDFGLPVYLMYDDDQAGEIGVETASALLRNYVPVMGVTYPEIWVEDPDDEEGGHWVKDPGELVRDDMLGMIDNAHIL